MKEVTDGSVYLYVMSQTLCRPQKVIKFHIIKFYTRQVIISSNNESILNITGNMNIMCRIQGHKEFLVLRTFSISFARTVSFMSFKRHISPSQLTG